MIDNSTPAYIPGICNINPREVAYRKKASIIGFTIAIVMYVVSLLLNFPNVIRGVLVFLPLFIGVIGYLQVKNSFCVRYGASGKQNATPGSKAAVDITDADAKLADKSKARSMNIQALVISLIGAAITMLIPMF
jgi:hypothetical protein